MRVSTVVIGVAEDNRETRPAQLLGRESRRSGAALLHCTGRGFPVFYSSMSTVLEYPQTELAETDYHAFNLALWDRLGADSALAALDFRIETDRHGQMIMSPPPAPSHGNKQSNIAYWLKHWLKIGNVISECPISTRLGVKVADVAWCSTAIWERLGDRSCFLESPEICVEVLSPSNTSGEMAEKKALYFEEGAKEVWICDREGRMEFYESAEGEARTRSKLAPEFPAEVS